MLLEAADGGHGMHVDNADAPITVEYVPAVQLMHDADEVEPVLGLYVPAVQEMHNAAPVRGV